MKFHTLLYDADIYTVELKSRRSRNANNQQLINLLWFSAKVDEADG